MDFTPKDAIKKVGRGKTLAQDLSYAEAVQAFEGLFNDAFSDAQAGAFLQALRIKELTQDELDGLVQSVFSRIQVTEAPPAAVILCLNLASDTARKGGILGLLAAQVLSRQGFGIGMVRSTPVLTGNDASFDQTVALRPLPSLLKMTAIDNLILNWSRLNRLRGELGFRSCLHTVEKLINPWPDRPLILGISHRQYAERLAGAMVKKELRGAIVLGNHGTLDLVLHKPTEVVWVSAAGWEFHTIPPDLMGLTPDSGIYSLAKFGDWKSWLDTGMPVGFRDALVLQTAFLGWVAGLFATMEAALKEAKTWVHAWGEVQ